MPDESIALELGEITISSASGPHTLPTGLILNQGHGKNVSSSLHVGWIKLFLKDI